MGDLMNTIMGSTFLIVCITSVCTTIPFVAVAGFLFYNARKSKGQADASQNWPSVLGTIISSRLDSRRTSDSDGGYSTSYYPTILYEYEVLGHRYQSDRVSFGGSVGSGVASSMQAVVDRYVPGNQIRVYYNPNNPGEAVLERSAGSSSKILTWVAIFILVFVVGTVCVVVVATVIPFLAMGNILNNIPLP